MHGPSNTLMGPPTGRLANAVYNATRRIVMMVTNNKIGTGAPHRVTPLDHIDSLVVEHDAATHSEFDAITRLGVDIVAGKSPA